MKRLLSLLALVALTGAGLFSPSTSKSAESVIVIGSSAEHAGEVVTDAGGSIISELQMIDGVVAQVPEGDVMRLRGDKRIKSVTADYPLTLEDASFDDARSSTYVASVNADDLHDTGVDGRGIGIALLDTGVADHPDLKGKIVASADLTQEGDFSDSYGHGTFLAGLLVGTGAASERRFQGIAPGAHLLSVKVAGPDGATTLGQVLYGLQLIDSSKDRYGIRIVTIALASPPTDGPDPLVLAVERLWSDGLVVVVAAGNSGPSEGSITSPGTDPFVVTVGATDERGTSSIADDVVPEWSARGPSSFGMPKPDLVAPGTGLVSLRASGSTIDRLFPSARIGDSYFGGSGTSMATAVTAGGIALLLQSDASLSPDQVKGRLMGSSAVVPDADRYAVGAGSLDVTSAMASTASAANSDMPALPRGRAVGPPGDPFPGSERSTFNWSPGSDGGDRWMGRGWAGADWTGRGWAGRGWAGRGWAGRGWAGQLWATADWSGRGWAGASWASIFWADESRR